MAKKKTNKRSEWVMLVVVSLCFFAFLYWVESWWGLIVYPLIFDVYVTKRINWSWWKEPHIAPATRFIMSWVDAIVFALVGIYFLNQFFFQNYVIPSSSLEKSLLTGDYLLVSKLSYGPRIPQTPLTMPLTQHDLPLGLGQSYIEWSHWEYRRIKGLGKVELNDIVVFNYPAGDTVALSQQNQDFYRLAYMSGDQALATRKNVVEVGGVAYDEMDLPSAHLHPDMPYAEQQAIFSKIYRAGRQYIDQHPEQFGKVKYRPTDRRENYVKRCVGLPGQTLQIKKNLVYLDGRPNYAVSTAQQNYAVTFCADLPDDLKREWGISNEDFFMQTEGSTHYMPLTPSVKAAMEQRHDLVEKIQPIQPYGEWLYPQNKCTGWTTSDYGPIWIPKKGETLALTLENLPIYERPIRVYEGNKLEVRGREILINDAPATSYTFKMDYYWLMGDNRDNSADSRFWGFVPEDHVVGKPLVIWFSKDPDYGLFDGGIRWKRLFKTKF